jgi:hypothetical protein
MYVLWEKVAKKLAMLLKFTKNLPQASNRPIGENSPTLVTLFGRHRDRRKKTAPHVLRFLWTLLWRRKHFFLMPGANPTTFEFTDTTPSLYVLCYSVFQNRKKIVFKTR